MAPARRNAAPLPAAPAVAAEPEKPKRKPSSRPSAAVAAERKALAIRRHAEKATPEVISAEAGVALQTVKGWMRDKAAFPPHPPEVAAETPERKAFSDMLDRVAALWASGQSRKKIADGEGMSDFALKGVMQRNRERFGSRDRRAAAAIARVQRGTERTEAAVGRPSRRRRAADQPAPAAAVQASEVDETPVSVDVAPVSTADPLDPVDTAPDAMPPAAPDVGAEAIDALFDAEIDEADERPIRGDAWRSLHDREPIGLMALTSKTCKWPLHRDRAGAQLFCGAATVDKKPWCAAHAKRAVGAGSSAERAVGRMSARALAPAGATTTSFPSEAVR